MKSKKADVNYKLIIYQNGFKALLIPIKNSKVFYLEYKVLTGKDHEKYPMFELAHFLEHMNGQFTSHKYPNADKNMKMLQKKGIQTNAWTAMKSSGYFISGLSKFIQSKKSQILDMFLESIIHFKCDKKQLEQERNSIINELKKTYGNNIWLDFYETLNEIVYKGHPREKLNFKNRLASVKTLTHDNLMDFRNTYYNPKKSLLVLAGDFDELSIKKILYQKLNSCLLKRKSDFLCQLQPIISFKKPTLLKKGPYLLYKSNKNVSSSKLQLTFFHDIDMFSTKNFSLRFLINILTGGLSSRLYEILRQKYGLVYYISLSKETDIDGLNYINFETDVTSENIPKIVDLILSEIKSLKKKGVKVNEIKNVKNSIYYSFYNNLLSKHPHKYASQYSQFLLWDDKDKIFTFDYVFKQLKKVNKESIQKVINSVFDPKRLIISYSGSVDVNIKLKKIIKKQYLNTSIHIL